MSLKFWMTEVGFAWVLVRVIRMLPFPVVKVAVADTGRPPLKPGVPLTVCRYCNA